IDKALEFELGEVTRQAYEMNIPVMIIIEGAPASGKSRLANALYMSLDAKYTDFVAARPPQESDLRYPFLHRYWYHLPKNGNINTNFKKIDKYMKKFEKTIKNNGYEILKFYINTDKKVRDRHLQKLKDNPVLKWKAEEFQSRLQHYDYDTEMKHFLDLNTELP